MFKIPMFEEFGNAQKMYFDTLSDLQFSPYVLIQLITVGVERSNGTPTGTSRVNSNGVVRVTEV